MTTLLVMGPKTTLGQVVLKRLGSRGRDVYVVARDPMEAKDLRLAWPGMEVLTLPDVSIVKDRQPREIQILALAFGIVRPADDDFEHDDAAFARDLSCLRTLLEANPQAKFHCVLVSTVLALGGARRDRLNYVAWKTLAEGQIMKLAAGRPDVRVSVFYPGRLVEQRTIGRPSTWTSTSYSHLADKLLEDGSRSITTRKLVGVDGRLWTIAQGFKSFLSLVR